MNEREEFKDSDATQEDGDATQTTQSGMALLAGRYRVVRRLGQGGMGSVRQAKDEKLDDRPVAVKMLPSILVNDKRAYRQVKKEALVSLKLSHPNIATVRAFEEDKGNPFLVMDYIDGQTLNDLLGERDRLTEEETVKLLGPVADALDYAHGAGVVHRDVKPGNVMVSKDGKPYVLDFGIAREIRETMTKVTGRNSSGTLMYMSPEQLNGDDPAPAQDVYSFAAMAYECLAGHAPFSRGQIEYQIVHNPPKPLPPGIGIGGQVMAGLAKKPEDRPLTCRGVLMQAGETPDGIHETGSEAWHRTDDGDKAQAKTLKPETPDIAFSLESDVCEWNGIEQCPRVVVQGADGLAEGRDYMVSFDHNIDIGEGLAAVVGVAACIRGRVWNLPFRIVSRSLVRAKVQDVAPLVYTGRVAEPVLKLTDPERQVDFAEGVDYAPAPFRAVDAGKGRVRVTGRGRYSGTVTVEYAIVPKDVSLLKVSPIPDQEYDGKAKRPRVTVRDDARDAELLESVDYFVAYGDEAMGGSQAVVVGRGNYRGRLEIPFRILPRDLAKTTVFGVPDAVRAVGDLRAAVKLRDPRLNDAELKLGRDYEFVDPKGAVGKAGRRTFALRGLGNYTGEKRFECEVKSETYMVVDLNDGKVAYLADAPSGGWSDEYKTDKLVLRRIEAGSFTMGSPTDEEGRDDDETRHRVTLTEPYYIGVFEVTQGQWERVMGSNPSRFKGPARPVERVSYNDIRGGSLGAEWPSSSGVDAGSFLGRLRAKTGQDGFDLPTEAQWENACRAGTTTDYAGNLDEMGWYDDNSGDETHEAGTKRPNAWGLYDMHGNVWEWCLDWLGSYGGDASDPKGPASGVNRVNRGGSWLNLARDCRSASRDGSRPGLRNSSLGFRLACSAGPYE